jgi:Tfp pilus assembly protein PilO
MKDAGHGRMVSITVLVLSLLVILASVGLITVAPRPDPEAAQNSHRKTLAKLNSTRDQAQLDATSAEKAAAKRIWLGDSDAVTSALMAGLTREADARDLKMAGFRAQRVVDYQGITELPFSVQVIGTYPEVRSFLAMLDKPGTRILLRSAQLASADAATDTVSATLGVSAFIRSVVAPAQAAKGVKRNG